MTKEEIKKFIEDHKAPIIIGIKLVGMIAMAVIIGKAISKPKNVPMEVIYDMPPVRDIPDMSVIPKSPDIPMGLIRHGISEWDTVEKGVLEFMTPYAQPDSGKYPTKLKDLYEILEALKDVPGIDDETDVWALFSVGRDNT